MAVNTDVCEVHNDTIDERDGCDPDVDLGDGGNQGGDQQSSSGDGDGVADEFDICEGEFHRFGQ